jgi:hypothetical protein
MKRIWGFGSRYLHAKRPDVLVETVMRRHFTGGDVLITGGAEGTDTIMEHHVMKLYGVPASMDHVITIRPNWKFKGAANARNVEMARTCDEAMGIWDVESKTGIDVNEVRNPDMSLNISLKMNKSGTWHSIVETIRKRKRLYLYIVYKDAVFPVVLKSDEIPEGSEFAMRKSA